MHFDQFEDLFDETDGIISSEHSTRGPDEVIAKSPIWLKLYQMNIWNPSRKDKKSFLQNMN